MKKRGLQRKLTISEDDPFLKMYPPDQPLTRPKGGEVSSSSKQEKHVSFLLEDTKKIKDFSKLKFFPNFDGTYDSSKTKVNTEILKHSDTDDSAEEDGSDSQRSFTTKTPRKYKEIDDSVAFWRDEAYWRLPENVRHAIDVAKVKSKHSEFWHKLQALNDKIFVFRSIFYNKMPSYQRAFLEKKQHALEEKLRHQKEEFEKEMEEINSRVKSKLKRRKTLALLIEKHFIGPNAKGKKLKDTKPTPEHTESGISAAQMIQNFRRQRQQEDQRKQARQEGHLPVSSLSGLAPEPEKAVKKARQWDIIEGKVPRRRAQSITFSNEKCLYNRLHKQGSETSSNDGDKPFQLSTLHTEANQQSIDPVQIGSESSSSIGRHLPKMVNLQFDKSLMKEEMNKIAEADELEEQMSPQKKKSSRINIAGPRRNSTPQSVRSSLMTNDKSGQMPLRESISDHSRRDQAKRSQKLSDFRLANQGILSSQSSQKKLAGQKATLCDRMSNIITMKPASSRSIDRISRDSKFIRNHKAKQNQIALGALKPKATTLKNIAKIIDKKAYKEGTHPDASDHEQDTAPPLSKATCNHTSSQPASTAQKPQGDRSTSLPPGADLSKSPEMSISLNSPQMTMVGEFTREDEGSSSAAFTSQQPASLPYASQPHGTERSPLRPKLNSPRKQQHPKTSADPQSQTSKKKANTTGKTRQRDLPSSISKFNRHVYAQKSKPLIEPFKKPLVKGDRLLPQLQRQQKRIEDEDRTRRYRRNHNLSRPNLDRIINGVRSKMQRHRARHLTPTKGQDSLPISTRAKILAEALRMTKAAKPGKFCRKLMQMEDIQFISSAGHSTAQDRIPTDLRRHAKEMPQSGPVSQTKNSFINDTSAPSGAATFTPIQDTFVEAAEQIILASNPSLNEDNMTDLDKPHVHSARTKPTKMGLDPSMLAAESRNLPDPEGYFSGQFPSNQGLSLHAQDPHFYAQSHGQAHDFKPRQGHQFQPQPAEPTCSGDRSGGMTTPKSPTMNIQEAAHPPPYYERHTQSLRKADVKYLQAMPKKRRDKLLTNPRLPKKSREAEVKHPYRQANHIIMTVLKSQKSSQQTSHRDGPAPPIKEKKKRGIIPLEEIKKDVLHSSERKPLGKAGLCISRPRDMTHHNLNEFSGSSLDRSSIKKGIKPMTSGLEERFESINEYSESHQARGPGQARRITEDSGLISLPIVLESGSSTVQPSVVQSRIKHHPQIPSKTRNRIKKELINSKSLRSSNYDSPDRRSTVKSPILSQHWSPSGGSMDTTPFSQARVKTRNESPPICKIPPKAAPSGIKTAATSTIKIMKSNFHPAAAYQSRLEEEPIDPILNRTQVIQDIPHSPVEGRRAFFKRASFVGGSRDRQTIASILASSGVANSGAAAQITARMVSEVRPLPPGFGVKNPSGTSKGQKQVNRLKGGSPVAATFGKRNNDKRKSFNTSMLQKKYTAIIQQHDYRPANTKSGRTKDYMSTQDQVFASCLAGDPEVLLMSKPYMPQS